MKRAPWIALLLIATSAIAQDVVKIAVLNNTVLVPVKLNGKEFLFLLDTGSETSIVDTAVATAMSLPRLGQVPVLKNYRVQVVGVAEAAMVQIGTAGFPHENLAVADLALLSRAVGGPVGGVLGNDVLQKITFRLSYSNERLFIGPLGQTGDLGTPVKLRRSGDQFFITVQLMSQARDLLLDTGTNSTNLSWNTWQDVSKAWPATSMVEGIARAGVAASNASLACLPKLRVGNADITDQAIRVQHAVGSGVFAAEEFDGILGSDVLREFEVTFDLGNDAIYLKKDSQFHADENRYVTIGVQFIRNDEGSYTVMSVWKDSPALEGGVRPGDQIKAVDGETTDAMNAQELSAKLHARQGTPVKLTIGRDGTVSTMTLETRQMLCGRENSRTAPQKSQ